MSIHRFIFNLTALCFFFTHLAACQSSDMHRNQECSVKIAYDSTSLDEPGVAIGGTLYADNTPSLFFSSSGLGEERIIFMKSAGCDYIISLLSNDADDEEIMFIMNADYLVEQVYLLVQHSNGRFQYVYLSNEKSKKYCEKYAKVWHRIVIPRSVREEEKKKGQSPIIKADD